jgi:hypothetical protein
MGRSSCMTTHMPTFEDTVLPESHLWDPDGYPQWIELGWRDWKSRKTANKGSRYGVRLNRNYFDPRFCPVMWLIIWLRYSGIKEGPIFGDISPKTYQAKTSHILRVFMCIKGATSHTIRRSSAQWAARCGDKGPGIRNAGRWKSFAHLITYLAQGAKQAERYHGDPNGDPILTCWPFQTVTSAGDHEQDDM